MRTQITLSEKKSNINKFKMKASKIYLRSFEYFLKNIVRRCAKISGKFITTFLEILEELEGAYELYGLFFTHMNINNLSIAGAI